MRHTRHRPTPQQAGHLRALFGSLAATLGGPDQRPVVVRHALRLALTRDPPLTSVRAWAAELGVRRDALWRAVRPWLNGLRPEDLLDAVLLARAVELRAGGTTWVEVGVRLGVHDHTIARIARRLLEKRLSELDADPLAIGRWLSSVLPEGASPAHTPLLPRPDSV